MRITFGFIDCLTLTAERLKVNVSLKECMTVGFLLTSTRSQSQNDSEITSNSIEILD